MAIGKIVQITGPVIDIKFDSGKMPLIHEAIEIISEGEKIVVEVMLHLGDRRVRCVSLSPTEGLSRYIAAKSTGAPISVPVGEETLGRIFNVFGKTIDDLPEFESKILKPIHARSPEFINQSPNNEIQETGIKVIDLLLPFNKGGKIGLFGGAGVGKTVLSLNL